jgi:hypothetical protein
LQRVPVKRLELQTFFFLLKIHHKHRGFYKLSVTFARTIGNQPLASPQKPSTHLYCLDLVVATSHRDYRRFEGALALGDGAVEQLHVDADVDACLTRFFLQSGTAALETGQLGPDNTLVFLLLLGD